MLVNYILLGIIIIETGVAFYLMHRQNVQVKKSILQIFASIAQTEGRLSYMLDTIEHKVENIDLSQMVQLREDEKAKIEENRAKWTAERKKREDARRAEL